MAVKEEVRVAIGQIKVKMLDTEANLERMAKALEEVASRGGADLVVFPELASQGYVVHGAGPRGDPKQKAFIVDYRREASPVPGRFSDGLGEIARKHNCYIISGLAEAHPTISANLYNSAVLVGPDGKVLGVHRKVHVPGAEKSYFHGGNTLEVYDTDLGKLSMMVCADFCAPEAARTLTMKGAEIICVPYAYAAGMYRDDEMFNRAQSTRAWENSNFMVNANQVGSNGEWEFWGRSCVADPFGSYIAMGEPFTEEVLMATLRRDDLLSARASYNRFRDRRPDMYGPLIDTFNQSWNRTPA